MSINTALSGLLTYQRALQTTSHNITNVATDGYTRQRVDLSARTPELLGNGYVGKGVQVNAVERIYDQYLVDNVNSRTSTYNQFTSYYNIASQLDTVLGDSSIGLSSAMEGFFNSVQDVASNPTSIPARQVVLSQAETLNARFQTINRQVSDLRAGVNSQMEAMVAEVNTIATAIADLNVDIVRASGEAGGGSPNDLLDQRDRLVAKLSEYTNVRTNEQSDRSMDVFIGSGQALVLGSSQNNLAVINDDFDVQSRQIAFVNGGVNIPITEQLSGGKLGGLINVRTQVLDVAQNSLGRIAIALSTDFNTQHQLGDDLSGTAGGLFFTDIGTSSPVVLPNQKNNPASGNFTVTIDDVNALKASDYRLNYDGTNYTVLRMSDKSVVYSGAGLPGTIASEGITLSLTGSVTAGDSFLVRPTRYAAGQTGLLVTDPADIAAAASGTASGNNANALSLAALQTTRGMAGSTASFQEAYGITVADIGVKTNQAGISRDSQKVLLDQAIEARNSVSGVNLDEEAANLIKFQQAYQAAAQLISVNDQLFQTLLNAVS